VIPYQVVFILNQVLPVTDTTVAAIDMANLQRPTKKRDSLTYPLEANPFWVKCQMQTRLEKLPYVHDTL
jgi:hypothetical protein